MGSFLETYDDSGFLGGLSFISCLIRLLPFLEILSTPLGFTRSEIIYSVLTVYLRGNFPTSRQRNDVFSKW